MWLLSLIYFSTAAYSGFRTYLSQDYLDNIVHDFVPRLFKDVNNTALDDTSLDVGSSVFKIEINLKNQILHSIDANFDATTALLVQPDLLKV